MVHLDLSNNQFTLEESKILAESLNEYNKTLYGYHFIGNYGYIDNRGFHVFNRDHRNQREGSVSHRIQGIQRVNFNTHKDPELFYDTCWICEGWQEKQFSWFGGQSGKQLERPIYLHLSHESYTPRYLGKPKSNYQFFQKRMVPFQAESFYFFTAGG